MVSDDCTPLLARLQVGDSEAARQLCDRFTPRLTAMAGARLDARLRTKVDPDDIIQSVFLIFFSRYATGRVEMRGGERLESLLAVITINECRQWNRHFRAAGRDFGREARLDDLGTDTAGGLEPLSRELLPEQSARFSELVERLRRELAPRNRPVLSLVIEGHSIAEISKLTGMAPRSVNRVLNQIRGRLERRFSD